MRINFHSSDIYVQATAVSFYTIFFCIPHTNIVHVCICFMIFSNRQGRRTCNVPTNASNGTETGK